MKDPSSVTGHCSGRKTKCKDKSYQEIESALMHLAGRMKIRREAELMWKINGIWAVLLVR